MSMFGQSDNTKVIKPLEATSSDYLSLLTASGYEAFPFDISSLSNGQYNITFKIKEYKYRQEIRDNVLGRENEIDPDMSSKILKYIPHYYIIGIEVNLITML